MNAVAQAVAEAVPATSPSTTDLFITVPQTTLPSGIVVPSFRVGQYVCTQGADGRAAVTAEGSPWVRINYHEAREACQAIGGELITELQWLALAYDIVQQPCNWTTGGVGCGQLLQGLRNGSVDGPQPGTYEPEDPDEQRFLTLSNGERIYDLAGNLFSRVFDNVQGDEDGLTGQIAADSISLTTAPYPSMEKGMGWRPAGARDWSGDALIRGGYWCSESIAGVFYLGSDEPDYRYDDVGFRCTKSL